MDDETIKKLENEAMITGGIPRRNSIARTPEIERKRKQSAPAILKSPEKETLGYPINNPEETLHSKKFKKQDGPAQEKQTRVETNYSDDKSKRWLNNIKEAKEKIIKATTRYSSGKLSFNKEEQTQVRENMDLIMDVMVEVAYELGRTERQQQEENFARKLDEQTKELQALRNIANETKEEIKKLRTKQPAATEAQIEIQKKTIYRQEKNRNGNRTDQPQTDTDRQTEDDTDKEWTESKQRKRTRTKVRTYAQTVQEDKTNKEGWKTPEHKSKLTTIVGLNEGEQNTKKVLERVREIARTEVKEQGAIKNLVPMKNGSILIHYRDATQQTLLTQKLQEHKDLRVKGSEERTPRLVLTGVTKGLSEEMLKERLLEENPDIQENHSEEIRDRTTIIARRSCRNELKENITVTTDMATFKKLMKMGKVYIDFMTVYTEEATSVALCYNCHKFGHVQKHCKDEPLCHVCGGQHRGMDCRSYEIDCPNCKKAGYSKDERQHTARDKKCPIFIRKENQIRQTINYSQK